MTQKNKKKENRLNTECKNEQRAKWKKWIKHVQIVKNKKLKIKLQPKSCLF